MSKVPITIELVTDRLMLRAADLSDVDLVWEVSRFEGFNEGMTWDPPTNKEEIVSITEKNIADWREGTEYVFTIAVKDENLPIGRMGLRQEDEPGIWNIGFWVHPDYWNRGIATEAALAVLEFGFSQIGADKITTDHAVWNEQSKSVIEKLGFRYIGENPSGFTKGNKVVAVSEYELTKPL